jgi:hypothetical protein
MKELLAFVLPPATALVGMRLIRLLLGEKFETLFGFGFRFVCGLGIGMLVFSQAVLAGALAGINTAGFLAWTAIVWGGAEIVLMAMKFPKLWKSLKFQTGHLWLLLLLPLIYLCWVFGRLSTLEGTLEFDANAFWVFKAKMLYLEQGANFLNLLHQTSLEYTHMDYPWLVPGLYALDYGVVGGVDEFVNKVWPFWMVMALCMGVLSLGNILKRPHPLPIVVVLVFCFLPASMQYIRWEGGTMPMVFYASLNALLLVNAITRADSSILAIAMPAMAGCAMAKFEGIVYGMVWFCALFPICWKYGWLKQKILWKSALVTGLCLLPFIWYRSAKPVPYPLSDWWEGALLAPGFVWACYPKALILFISARFFNGSFFDWQLINNIHLQWDGKWTGLNSLVNDQLSVLPWLLLVLLVFSLWKKRERLALSCLTAAILGVFAFLTFVMACLCYTQSDTNTVNFTFAFIHIGPLGMGRYFYPFFVAWFLGITAVWFATEKNSPAPKIEVGRQLPPAPVQNSKQRQ